MILLSMEDRNYAMFVYGPKASEVFNAYGQEQLETYFLDNFRDDDWYGGFGDYIDACSNYLQLAEQGTPVSAPEGYDSGDYEDYEATPGENFGVSFLMALGNFLCDFYHYLSAAAVEDAHGASENRSERLCLRKAKAEPERGSLHPHDPDKTQN